jgi:D-alanyl-D-alanine-carboxypeptidase/D-alanyl-D-alanine-endopeptidase
VTEPDPARRARLAEASTEIDAVFARFAEDYRVPGMAYGVVVDGALAYASGVGRADTATADPPGPATVFRIASMTKSITACCLLMLRDDGLIRLDDPVADHVPELEGLRYPTTDSPPLTVRLLLSMSSGLVEDDPWADRLLDMDAATFGKLLAGGLAFDHPPATTYEYSNLGYAILGRLVANVAGVPLRRLATERLFTPLGLADTTWDADQVPPGARAVGYRVQDGDWIAEESVADGAFAAMGGIATSVRDLARLVAMHLSAWPPRDDPDDGPLRRSSLREMATAHQAGPTYFSAETPAGIRSDGYGYGLVSTLHERDGRVVGHSGGLPGFASHMEWLPDRGVGVIGLANRTYVPVRLAVRQAFDALATAGALQPHSDVASPALVATRQAIVALYERWDPAVAAETMLGTYFLDLDDNRKPPDFAQLRAVHGACVGIGEITPTGALRGAWRMTCERGVLEVTAMLGPTLPSRVQYITVTALGVPAAPGG